MFTLLQPVRKWRKIYLSPFIVPRRGLKTHWKFKQGKRIQICISPYASAVQRSSQGIVFETSPGMQI